MEVAKNPKILLVEDDLGLASLYAARLSADGYTVVHCSEASKALQMGRELVPDLIIMDLMMPMQSGFETLQLFKQTAETAQAKILIMSALSQQEDIDKTKQLGADDYMIKSQLTLDEVVEKVHQYIAVTQSTSLSGSDAALNGSVPQGDGQNSLTN